jgi:DNA-binding response OmpR family regulator
MFINEPLWYAEASSMTTPAYDPFTPSVLIVDDESTMRVLIRYSLQHENYRLIEAENGTKAVQLFEQYKPDLILLDLMMPDIDGFETCRHIREKDKTVPILVLTNLSDDSAISRAFDAGADDFVTKPANWAVLKQRAQRLIRFRVMERELQQYRENLENLILERTTELQAVTEALQKTPLTLDGTMAQAPQA